MSAICGLVVPAGAPPPMDRVAEMMRVLAPHGPDGGAAWQDGEAALGQQRTNFDGSPDPEPLPLHDADSGLTLILDGLLHNRSELAADLGMPTADGISDQELLLRSWMRWGPACVEHWVGEFAVALWDARAHRLHCITDPMGIRPLFWKDLPGGGFAFASEVAALLVFEPAAPLNERRLALMGLSALTGSLEPESTVFRGICRLPAARALCVAREGRQVREHWRPDPDRRLHFASDAECGEAMEAVLVKAVRARLRTASPVAALLSGGLDSSSLVTIAARLRGEAGLTLTSVSAVADSEMAGQVVDERRHIERLRSTPNLDMHYVTASGHGPFDDLELLVAPGSLPSCSFQHFLYTALVREAAGSGARVVLDGHGGELSASCYPAGWLAELLLHGRLTTLAREFQGLSRSERGAWSAFRTGTLRPLLGPGLLRTLGRGRNPNPGVAWPLREEFVRDVLASDRAGIRDELGRKLEPRPDHRRNMVAALREEQDDIRLRSHAGFVDYAKVRFSYPFLDRRVIDFALAVDGRFKQEGGEGRRLLRLAMRGTLDAGTLERRDKAPFSPDYAMRYEAQRAQAAELLREFLDAAPQRELVDFERVFSALGRPVRYDPKAPMRVDPEAAFLVPYALYLCYFLERFSGVQRQGY